MRAKTPRKDNLTAKSAVENTANMDPEHSVMFVKNTRTKEKGLVFANFVGQTGTLDSEM